jgi:hypothetical protein
MAWLLEGMQDELQEGVGGCEGGVVQCRCAVLPRYLVEGRNLNRCAAVYVHVCDYIAVMHRLMHRIWDGLKSQYLVTGMGG